MAEKTKIDLDELRKSLKDLEFEENEISDILQKAEQENEELDQKPEPKEKEKPSEPKEKEDTETIDEQAQEVKKAYDEIKSMKDKLDKSMEEFLNRFGSAPGIPTPSTDLAAKGAEPIQKSEVNDFEKAFGAKVDSIEKSFGDFMLSQNKVNEDLVKSLENINGTVQAIASAPNPLKGIYGTYGILEKGEEKTKDGKRVISLTNKDAANAEFFKAIDSIDNEDDKQTIRDMVSSFNVSGKLNPVGLNIVKKALDIDFEK